MNIAERKEYLRTLIPKTKSGDCKTDRLETLDSILHARKCDESDLDFIEKEIRSAIEFFENKKFSTSVDDLVDNNEQL